MKACTSCHGDTETANLRYTTTGDLVCQRCAVRLAKGAAAEGSETRRCACRNWVTGSSNALVSVYECERCGRRFHILGMGLTILGAILGGLTFLYAVLVFTGPDRSGSMIGFPACGMGVGFIGLAAAAWGLFSRGEHPRPGPGEL